MAKGLQRRVNKKGRKLKGRTDPGVSDFDRYPKFSLRLLQGNYCVSSCTKDEKAAFAETLRKLSTLRWKDIYNAPRHGLGREKISTNAIKAPVPPEAQNEKIIAIRFHGKCPMVGFRKQATFYVLWVDRNHELY